MADSKNIDDGGPAFSGGLFEPQHGGSNDREPWNAGMSMRQYYAGQALVGLLSNDQMTAIHTVQEMSSVAISAADALIAALKAGA